MWKTIIKVFLFCFLVTGCSMQNKDVALIVNGKKITNQQMAQAVETFRQNVINTMPEKALESFSSNLRATVARQLITNQLMIDEAKKRKISIDSNMVNKAFEKLRSSFSTPAEFEKEMSEMGETEKSVKEELEKGALLDTLIKVILQQSDTVTEQDCRDFYEKNSSRYLSQPRYRASQIFLAADSVKERSKWEKSRKDVQQLAEKLKAGESFDAAMKKYNGGDIGWFKKGDLKPVLDNAISSKKIGEISEVVCTEVGFHILKKTEEENGKVLSFEEVKDNIQMMMSLRKKTDFLTTFTDSLINKAKITYIDTSLVPNKAGMEK